MTIKTYDLLVIGAGAAGLMAAFEAAKRLKSVLVIDHAAKPAEKIRISGGGKCNFTHLKATPKNFLSANPAFCISALKRFTPWDFLDRVISHNIPYFEKTEGQLFCERSAQDIIDMLLVDLAQAGGELWLKTCVHRIEKTDGLFTIDTSRGPLAANKLVIATGGLSIPKMGATGFAYDIARQFGHEIIDTRAGLVPFTLAGDKLAMIEGLAGVSVAARIKNKSTVFEDGFLFTHRGLSGPACLQISNYWQAGQAIDIDLAPEVAVFEALKAKRRDSPKQQIDTVLADLIPKRLAERVIHTTLGAEAEATRMADTSDQKLKALTDLIQPWSLIPDGTEGYRTAEVTLGGVDTRQLSSQTMESQLCSGLYFIGECVDVTGWLGGYNFQWAWSSGWACGRAL
jgi:predicted Rossmann fold flavoprotein